MLILSDDFNNGVIDSQNWELIESGSVVRGFFTPGPDSLFFGGAGRRRLIQSVPVNISTGGTISFDLIFGSPINNGSDVGGGEDVALEYSIDGGSSWFNIATYDGENYSQWTTITENLPAFSLTSSTRLRLRQTDFDISSNTPQGADNWGLDNIRISNTSLISKTGIEDNFDLGFADSSDWVDIRGGLFTAGGFNPTAADHLFFGGPTNANLGTSRLIESAPVDISNGGTIRFDLIFGSRINNGSEVGGNEDVSLQYSVDGGNNWFDIASYDGENYSQWTTITEDMPSIALTSATRLRLLQTDFDTDNTATGVDNWGLDNISITNTPLASKTNIQDNFDAGSADSSDWVDIRGGIFINGGFNSAADHLFFGGPTNANLGTSRLIESAPVDVQNGGTIRFDLIFGSPINNGSDVGGNEDVSLQYSVDGGANWFDIASYDGENYSQWTTITENIPGVALTSATRLRLLQTDFDSSNTDTGVDNWGLDNVSIINAPLTSKTNIQDNFNTGSADSSDWVDIRGGIFINGGFKSAADYLFFGGPTNANLGTSRLIESAPVDVSNGGTISFDLIFGDGRNGGSNVGGGEDVVLEYSTDDGTSWTNVATYDSEEYLQWTTITETLPTLAQTSNTRLRLRQVDFDISNTATGLDNWGLDNISISSGPVSNPNIVWRNTQNGTNVLWDMNNAQILQGRALPTLSPEWQLAATADFNNDGQKDLFWRHGSTGVNVIWTMNETAITGAIAVPTLGTEWQLGTTGDFNNDGQEDLVWRNSRNGANVVWYLNQGQLQGGQALPSLSNDWTLATSGDFNNDGNEDLVWRNSRDGSNAIWYTNGSLGLIGGEVFSRLPDLAWQIAGSADMNLDGHDDLLLRNTNSGVNVIWNMNGAAITGGTQFSVLPGSQWQMFV